MDPYIDIGFFLTLSFFINLLVLHPLANYGDKLYYNFVIRRSLKNRFKDFKK